jgi:hypothetical protein
VQVTEIFGQAKIIIVSYIREEKSKEGLDVFKLNDRQKRSIYKRGEEEINMRDLCISKDLRCNIN